jgi:hypothetical protein
MLAEALREDPIPRAPLTFAEVNARMPEWGGPHRWPQQSPRFVKTHRPYTRLLARQRSLLLVRDPLDALASYHRLWSARLGAETLERDAFLKHSRLGLPRWLAHTRSWMPRVDCVLAYRSLRDDPAEGLRRACALAGIAAAPTSLADAVSIASPERVRGVQRRWGVDGTTQLEPDFVFARDTPPGAGIAYFSPEAVRWAEAMLEEAGLGRGRLLGDPV